ncbi:MAG: hypothetical protein GXO85_17375 [Chlorobi bacterium]|nr:hypothetical protein [Chlorobiota bacterium]
MESIKDDLALRLLRQLMQARNASFIELVTFLLPKIYPLVFILLPKKEIAVQILVKVLLQAKKIFTIWERDIIYSFYYEN